MVSGTTRGHLSVPSGQYLEIEDFSWIRRITFLRDSYCCKGSYGMRDEDGETNICCAAL